MYIYIYKYTYTYIYIIVFCNYFPGWYTRGHHRLFRPGPLLEGLAVWLEVWAFVGSLHHCACMSKSGVFICRFGLVRAGLRLSGLVFTGLCYTCKSGLGLCLWVWAFACKSVGSYLKVWAWTWRSELVFAVLGLYH